MGNAVRDLAVDAGLARLSFEPLPVAVPEAADRIGIQRDLARRQDLDCFEDVSRQL